MSQAAGRWRAVLLRMACHARRRRPVCRAGIELLEERCVLYAVNNAGDLPLDSKIGPAETVNGTITLRSAIEQINIDGSGSITFSGAMTINVGSQLDPITATGVTIDGGTVGSVVISGNANSSGLVINGGGATIKNLVINGFGYDAIWLASFGNTVQNDYVGTNASGSSAVANGVGILDTIGDNMITNSVVSGNSLGGIGLVGSANDQLTGDKIGTNVLGTIAIPNLGNGILIDNSAKNNTIGGTTVAARNILSGNTLCGIQIEGDGTSGNFIEGNYIGTDASGAKSLPNGTVNLGSAGDGVLIDNGATDNLVGGTASGAGNLVSGNVYFGVQVATAGTSGNLVEGNDIGTDSSGMKALPNGTPGVIAGNGGVVINFGAASNTVGGTSAGARNLISGNYGTGVGIADSGSSNNVVQGNWIGVNQTGMAALANTYAGVVIGNAIENMGYASANTIGGSASGAGNLISGNGGPGISILGSNNLVQGNLIGSALGGTKGLGNNGAGVSLSGQATSNTIGGTSAGSLNVISGYLQDGVDISGMGTSSNVVEGNYIGTNITGTSALPNGTVGKLFATGVVISAGATANLIGGSETAERNVISGNLGNGVEISDAGTSNNVVMGNFIGTDVNGTTALPNGTAGTLNNGAGVVVDTGATANTIGGTSSSALNLISGNVNFGVQLSSQGTSSNLVEGNDIGTDVTGMNALPNGVDGVRIDTGASQNTLGGYAMGAGNVIAFNTKNGVTVGGSSSDNSNGDTIEGNSIYANQGLGIDLGNDGVTGNDSHNHSSGPNDWQDFPVLQPPGAGGAIVATLTGAPGTYRIEFFVSTTTVRTVAEQGQTFLGSASLTVGANATGTVSFTPQTSLASGASITATATAPNGDTSEFSQDFTLFWVTFEGDGFRPITDDTNNFQTYSTQQWLSGPDAHQEPVFYAASSTLNVSTSWQAASVLPVNATVMAQGTGPAGITIPPTAVSVDGNILTLSTTAATTPFDDDAQFFQDFAITWQLSLDGGKTWVNAGKSDDPLYVSASTNPQPDMDSSNFYLTVVNAAVTKTVGIAMGSSSGGSGETPAEASIITDVFSLFAASPSGPANFTRFDGMTLTYYGTQVSATDPTGQQLLWTGYTTNTTVGALLATGDGQCSTWTGLFLDMLLADGVSAPNDYITVGPTSSTGFLVQDWVFSGTGKSGNSTYPYLDVPPETALSPGGSSVNVSASYDVTKSPGVAGQNSSNPESFFGNHQIALLFGTYYDPSYGNTYASLPAMAFKVVAGYYKRVLTLPASALGLAPSGSNAGNALYVVPNAIEIEDQTGDTLKQIGSFQWGGSSSGGGGSGGGAGASPAPDQSPTPLSTVDPLSSTASSSTFTVGMAGADDGGGAGVASFALYVSTNGGPYVLDQSDIPAQGSTGGVFTASTSFTGTPGDTYAFYSVATDTAGNVEAPQAAAQATTTVMLPLATSLSNVGASGTYAGTATLTALLTAGGSPLAGQTVSFTLTIGGSTTSVGTATTGANGVANLPGVSLAGLDAGTANGAVGASYAGDASELSTAASGDATVNPAPLTVTADNASSTAGQPLPAFTASYRGFANHDGPGVLEGVLGFTVPAGAAGQAGEYPITPGGLSASNYTITYVNGTLTVGPALVPPVDVVSAQWRPIKTSRRKTAQALVVTFSGALDPADANDLAAYHLFAVSKGKKPGTRKETTVGLASAKYNATGHSVTLLPRGTVPKPPLELTLNPTLLLDAEERPLSGDVMLTLARQGSA